jgi:hypothetical protein
MNDSAAPVKKGTKPAGWLLLVHQIPPKPDYFRVKVRRRLQRIGAVPLKNSVYVLPSRPETLEDFRWLLREIVEDGGDGTLCTADFVEGITGDELQAMFIAERDAEYREIASAANELQAGSEQELGRLRRQLAEVAAIDYFGAAARTAAERALQAAEARLSRPGPSRPGLEALRGHTWVTRNDVFVDRIASAWLIRRFIDPKASFKFTGSRTYRPRAGEVRFDMFEAEYTHEGDRCTFEILLDRSGLRDRALRSIAEIVHDIDCKDGKFGREEAPGLAALLKGVTRAQADDGSRLEHGGVLFDQLYASLHSSR